MKTASNCSIHAVLSKFILAAFVALGAFTLPASAQTAIQFQGSGTALAPTDTAGLASVAQANWNVVTTASFSNVSLLQADGVTAGGVLNGGANGTYFGGSSTALPAGNSSLASGELYNGWPDSPTLTISSIPYAAYDVYLYAGIDAGGRFENAVLTPSVGAVQSFGFTTEGGGSSWTLATGTATWDGTGPQPSAPTANYVEFTDVTGSSFSLAWGAPGNGGLNGIEIVPIEEAAVPEPSSFALMFAGLGGLAFYLRRRRSVLGR
jgi:hypothetical protein